MNISLLIKVEKDQLILQGFKSVPKNSFIDISIDDRIVLERFPTNEGVDIKMQCPIKFHTSSKLLFEITEKVAFVESDQIVEIEFI